MLFNTVKLLSPTGDGGGQDTTTTSQENDNKQPTLEELIAIKQRLCWVWDYEHQQSMKILAVVDHSGEYPGGFRFQSINGVRWKNAQMLTDDEIKQFLSGE